MQLRILKWKCHEMSRTQAATFLSVQITSPTALLTNSFKEKIQWYYKCTALVLSVDVCCELPFVHV